MSDDKKCFTVFIKIKTETYQEHKLNRDYYKANRLYNNVVRYVKRQVKQIERTCQGLRKSIFLMAQSLCSYEVMHFVMQI